MKETNPASPRHCPVCKMPSFVLTYGRDVCNGKRYVYSLSYFICGRCQEPTITLYRRQPENWGGATLIAGYPEASTRAAAPEVPHAYAAAFEEAASILGRSPRASAALSRSCLQRIMREVAGAKGKDLFEEIEAAIVTQGYNSSLKDQLHHIRETGNYALHVKPDRSTGEIVEVGPDEAEWNLDILELLFDHHFVMPAKAAKMAKAWAEKKKGKPGAAGIQPEA